MKNEENKQHFVDKYQLDIKNIQNQIENTKKIFTV